MQMLEESGERTLLVARPVRLANLRYYIMMIVMVIVAGYLAFFKSSFFPDYVLFGRSVYLYVELLLVFIAFIAVIVAEFRRVLQQYIVTNLRVIDTYGVMRKSTNVMMANQIERVYTTQGVLQRLFRYGDVVVDTGEDQMVLASIRQPTKVEGTITQAMASRLPSRR